jgi:ATP-dependent RNA helicase HelY
LLTDRGYLADDTVTAPGRTLARIWSDSDLVVAECLRAGTWEGLAAAELAAVVSCLVYEPRREEREVARLPTVAVRDALRATSRIWGELADDELERGLVRSRQPESGFCWPAYRWARREGLDEVLAATAESGPMMSAGDFVRWCKQLLDLLSQLANLTPVAEGSTVPAAAHAAIDSIRRGVIAQSMLT